MRSVRRVRHHIFKSPVARLPLTWFQHWGVHSNDFFLAAYPRSGSTWLRFMLFELLTGQDPDFQAVDSVIPSVKRKSKAPDLLFDGRRLLHTHYPYRGEYRKAIYLVRDVRDVLVSEYHYCKRLQFHNGDIDSFFDKFLKGKANKFGFWADHVNSWLNAAASSHATIKVIRFEDMYREPQIILEQLLNFLNVNKDPEIIQKAIDNNSIGKMQKKEDLSAKFEVSTEGFRFINKGTVGKGQAYLTDHQLRKLEQRSQKALSRLGYSLNSTTSSSIVQN